MGIWDWETIRISTWHVPVAHEGCVWIKDMMEEKKKEMENLEGPTVRESKYNLRMVVMQKIHIF